jgi:hypothetical protein
MYKILPDGGSAPEASEQTMTQRPAGRPTPVVEVKRSGKALVAGGIPKPTTPPRPAPPKQRITTEDEPPVSRDPRRRRALPLVRGANGEPLMPHIVLFGEGFVPSAVHARGNRVVAKLGIEGLKFYRVCIPDVGWRYWFMVPNDGVTPLDPTIEPRIIARLVEKGIYLPRGRLLPGQLPKGTPARCGKYIGDNDGTCPQLTCIRAPGHEGGCDNVNP